MHYTELCASDMGEAV